MAAKKKKKILEQPDRYRKIALKMHGDEKYRRLTRPQPCGQVLWWYLLAGPQTGIIPGVFSIGEQAFAELLEWPLESFRESFREVLGNGLGMVDWSARFVFIPNAIKYNAPHNPNIVKSWKAAWAELPECELKVKAWHALRDFLKESGDAFVNAFVDHCRNHSGNGSVYSSGNKEKEKEKEKESEFRARTQDIFPDGYWPEHDNGILLEAARRNGTLDEHGGDIFSENGKIVPDAPKQSILPSKAESPAIDRDSAWETILERCRADLAALGDELNASYRATYLPILFSDDFQKIFDMHPKQDNQRTAMAVWRRMVRTPAIRDCVVRGHEAWHASGRWRKEPEYAQHFSKWLDEFNFMVRPEPLAVEEPAVEKPKLVLSDSDIAHCSYNATTGEVKYNVRLCRDPKCEQCKAKRASEREAV